MKRLLLLSAAVAVLFSLIACSGGSNVDDVVQVPTVPEKTEFEKMYEKASVSYEDGKGFTITSKGETDKVYFSEDEKTIYLLSLADVDAGDDEPEYDVTGDFEGQIYNLTKGSVLNLKGANLSNVDAPAIYAKKKIEISAKSGTVNKITVTTSDPSYDKTSNKIGAVQCEKKIEIGGAGTLTITSSLYHGVKAEEVQLKGSGKHYIYTEEDSTASSGYAYSDGSAINCKELIVNQNTKAFTITFAGFKHGIKADLSIEIHVGLFHFEDVTVPFKTDTKAKDPDNEHKIIVSNSGDSKLLKFYLSSLAQTSEIVTDGDVTIPDGVCAVPVSF